MIVNIRKKCIFAALLLNMQVGYIYGITRNIDQINNLEQVLLTDDQTDWLVRALEDILVQAQEYDGINRACRPDSASLGDGVFPACNVCNIAAVSACCCSIRNLLCCLTVSLNEVLGSCTDISILLPSVVDKSEIDAICATVITLLKTILLELRGAFTSL